MHAKILLEFLQADIVGYGFCGDDGRADGFRLGSSWVVLLCKFQTLLERNEPI